MNPLTVLYLYLLFSISTLLSINLVTLGLHFLLAIILIIYKKQYLENFIKLNQVYLIYLPLTGFLFFCISFFITSKPILEVILEVAFATFRILITINIMSLYIVQTKSDDIIIAIRSIWYRLKLNWRLIDQFLLFLEMTIRFFPSFQNQWMNLERSQKALSISNNKRKIKNIKHIANDIPGFIILNLEKTETITDVMTMRGYGENIPRSIFPFIKYSILDFGIAIISLIIIFGVHGIAKI